MDYLPFLITLKLAVLTTLLLVVICVPLAHYVAYSRRRVSKVVESLVLLPIVLPPTVIGYYFIVFLGPKSGIGSFFEETLGIPLTFSFTGILVGSLIYCLPFMMIPLVNGFRSIPANLRESAELMGKSKWSILTRVILPNAKNALWSSLLLTFAHTIGEFGVVLMIGGNLPETQTASIAIYDEMNRLNFAEANTYAIALLAISFVIVLSVTLINRTKRQQFA